MAPRICNEHARRALTKSGSSDRKERDGLSNACVHVCSCLSWYQKCKVYGPKVLSEDGVVWGTSTTAAEVVRNSGGSVNERSLIAFRAALLYHRTAHDGLLLCTLPMGSLDSTSGESGTRTTSIEGES